MRALVGALGEAGAACSCSPRAGTRRCRSSRSSPRDSGRPVMIAALLHNSTNPDAGVRRARRDRRGQRARPPARRRGVVLPAGDGLHAALALPVRGAGELAAGACRSKGEAFKAKLREQAFRDAVRAELARPGALPPVQRRMGQGARDRVAQPRRLEQRSIAELAREAGSDPLDFMLDLALDEDLDTVFTALLLNTDEDAVGTDAAPSARAWCRCPTPARTSPSSTMPASACTCSATGCASAAR